MTLFDFIEKHPYWTFLFVAMVLAFLHDMVINWKHKD